MPGRSPGKYAPLVSQAQPLIIITFASQAYGQLPTLYENGFALLEILALVVVMLQKGHYKALYRSGK